MLSGAYIPGRYDKYVLYIEGAGKETSFTIRNFTCDEKIDSFDTTSLPALKTLYADKFDFGTAVVASEVADSKRMAFYGSQFTIMTAGNEMKPDSLLDMSECQQAQPHGRHGRRCEVRQLHSVPRFGAATMA